jgi:hypothetical protein
MSQISDQHEITFEEDSKKNDINSNCGISDNKVFDQERFDMEFPSDPNTRIAPWFNILNIHQQIIGKSIDFQTRLESLDRKLPLVDCKLPEVDQKIGEDIDMNINMKIDTKIGMETNANIFYESFDSAYGGLKFDGYRNKNKFVFGYSRDYLQNILEQQNDLNTIDNSKYVTLGFVGGNYPTSYIMNASNACAINDKFKKICEVVDKIVRESKIKPFMQPPHIKRKIKKKTKKKSNQNTDQNIDQKIEEKLKEKKSSGNDKHRGVWKYLTVRSSDYEKKYVVTLSNYVKHVRSNNIDLDIDETKYNSVIQNISDELNKLDFVKSFGLVEYDKSFEPQPCDVPRILFSKDVVNDFMNDFTKDEKDLKLCSKSESKSESKSKIIELLSNPGYVCEKILDKIFMISPNSFFQVNTETTIILYEKIRAMLESMLESMSKSKPKTELKTHSYNYNVLIDMYCGTGSIGLCMADMFDQIIGIDVVSSCIDDATNNAKLNGIDNAKFVLGRCEDVLDKINDEIQNIRNEYSTNKMNDIGVNKINFYIVVDPAREGIHKRVRKFISSFDFAGLIYCSCNVNTWFSDVLDLMTRSKMKIKPIKTLIVDMFPHTQHYEVLSSFTK